MSICLSMIVKNEAHCIVRCLESVKSVIDYWIICDTGSTDGTQNIIKEYLKDIPGELHQKEWIDFSTNRNQALELSKTKADYSLIIDADDYLIIEKEDAFDNINAPVYFINIRHHDVVYSRLQLVKNTVDAKYIGVLHEYLSVPPNTKIETLHGCHMYYGANGARSKDASKYLKDAEVFEKVLEKEPNNPRNVFYCAQSYRDAGNLNKALEKYLHRVQIGGWEEECFIAALNAARITENLYYNNIEKVQSIYLKAHNILPTRVEALCGLATYCRKKELFDLAYFYAKIGSQIPQPDSGLFLETACYTWKIHDELSVSAFYTGKTKDFKDSLLKLVNNKNIPESELKRINFNLKFI